MTLEVAPYRFWSDDRKQQSRGGPVLLLWRFWREGTVGTPGKGCEQMTASRAAERES
jgi:hypothetical protein